MGPAVVFDRRVDLFAGPLRVLVLFAGACCEEAGVFLATIPGLVS
jgi:hypothetical protein